MEKCPFCGSPIERYTERKCFENVKELSKDTTHFHYGTPYYKYGICHQFHFVKGILVKTVWNPCYRCNFLDVVQKNRENRETPRPVDDLEISQDLPRSPRSSDLVKEIRHLREELASLKKFLGIRNFKRKEENRT